MTCKDCKHSKIENDIFKCNKKGIILFTFEDDEKLYDRGEVYEILAGYERQAYESNQMLQMACAE